MLAATCFFVAIGNAHALESTAWDFRGQIPVNLTAQGITTTESTAEGLFIRTDTDGFLVLPTLTQRADTVTLTVTNLNTPKVALIWRTETLREGEYYQQNVTVPVGLSQSVSVALNNVPEWDSSASTLGLAFPTGSELLLETIEWHAYSPLEKLSNGMKSFWTTDRFTLYSINFLWGPLIATTPEGRAMLYDGFPPTAWSAMRIVYGIAVLAMIIGAATCRILSRSRKTFLVILTMTVSVLWIVLDLRMSQEIFSYIRDDWQTYVLPPADQKTLRTHATLYNVLAEVRRLLGDDNHYVLLAQEGTPFFANVRYALYPAVPVPPAEARASTAWIILGNTHLSVASGALLRDGVVLSPRGTLVQRFDESSFFYRSLP